MQNENYIKGMIEIPPIVAVPPITDHMPPVIDCIPSCITITGIPSDIKITTNSKLPPVEWPPIVFDLLAKPQNKPDLRGVLTFNVREECTFRQANEELIKRLERMNIGCVVIESAQAGTSYVDLRK